ARHLSKTIRSRGFLSGSPPISLAAIAISLANLEKIRPRLASIAPLKCLTFAHLLCPAIIGSRFPNLSVQPASFPSVTSHVRVLQKPPCHSTRPPTHRWQSPSHRSVRRSRRWPPVGPRAPTSFERHPRAPVRTIPYKSKYFRQKSSGCSRRYSRQSTGIARQYHGQLQTIL